MHTWDEHDGLASTVTATLSGGFSGYALTHSDVGGYNGGTLWLAQLLFGVRVVRTPELLHRWVELCAFSGAVFRTHEGLVPDFNHQVWSDDFSTMHFKKFALVFVAFRPYRRALMAEAHAKGWPLIRHPVLHFPNDPVLLADREEAKRGDGYGRLREFMLGADWLIVPVMEPGAQVCPLLAALSPAPHLRILSRPPLPGLLAHSEVRLDRHCPAECARLPARRRVGAHVALRW